MSLQVDESVYNLIPRNPPKLVKGDRHASKFKSNIKNESASSRYPYKTMGPAKVPAPNTDQFLKKSKPEDKSSDEKFKYPDQDRRRPPVPKQDDKPMMGIRTNKNFITTNAVENIMSVPRKPENNFCDTRHGDKQPLETSGLHPKYTNKKEFGKCPIYLKKRQEEIAQAQQEYDDYVQDYFRRGAMIKLSNEERESILNGLKTNWEALHHDYQGLSVVTDTAPKKYRKERMEAEMKALERDIELIEKHGVIYIAN